MSEGYLVYSSNSKNWRREKHRVDTLEFISTEEISGLILVMGWSGGSRPHFFLEVGGERAEEFVYLLQAYWEDEIEACWEDEQNLHGVVHVFSWMKQPWNNPFWDNLKERVKKMESPILEMNNE